MKLGHTVLSYDVDYNKTLGFQWDGKPRELDGVVIASPTNCHGNDIARLCGVPTFVEKPILSDDLPTNTSAVHIVGYNLRFHPIIHKIKTVLMNNGIGEVQLASIRLLQKNERPSYKRDGVILNWSHEIDLALHLFGPGQLMTSTTKLDENKQDIDSTLIISHESGTVSTIHLDYVTEPWVRDGLILGSNGYIKYDLERGWCDIDGQQSEIDPQVAFDESYLLEIGAFISSIDGERSVGCTGSEALSVLDICLEARKNAGL